MNFFKINLHRNLYTAVFFTLSFLLGQKSFAQKNIPTPPPDSIKYLDAVYQKVKTTPTYPKTVAYLSFLFPLTTLQNGVFTPNFSNQTTSIGFPTGINIFYSKSFGFSYELTPTIKASGGSSKMSNLLFAPGTMFRFDHGFTVITRIAFETSGRYGFTPVFNKIYARTKAVNYFIAGSLPTRFGNGANASVGLSVQFGFLFN